MKRKMIMTRNCSAWRLIAHFLIVGVFSLLHTFSYAQIFSPTGTNQKHLHVASSLAEIDMKISFNETIPFTTSMAAEWEKAPWTISNEYGIISSGQRFDDIKNFVFTTPGRYEIEFETEPMNPDVKEGTCFHVCNPPRISLSVEKYRLSFIKESLDLSNPIISGQETTGTSLFLQLKLDSYDGSSIVYAESCSAAGINTDIAGTLTGLVELTPGVHQLTYQLTGKVKNAGTYISFDFFDPMKGITWSFPIMDPIQ